jgi:GNAT superfamily N-acetyltransferase
MRKYAPGAKPPADGHLPAPLPLSAMTTREPDGLTIREAADGDSEQVIGLVAAVYGEYPGCILDVDGEAPHLLRPASAFAERGGTLWVAELDGAIVACCGFADRDEAVELLSLYVAAPARRRGLGRRLAGLVEAAARRRGRPRLELWTDTRFLDAHRLYEQLGYVRGGTRKLHDLSGSVEHHYRKSLV